MRSFLKLLQIWVLTLLWGAAMAQAPYCTPTYNYGCTYGDGLILFQLNTINQSIPCSGSPEWYHDYTSISTDLTIGTNYTLTVQAGYGSTYVDVWIDFNNNNVFDATECVVNDLICTDSYTNYTANINIPAGTATGPHRLRYRTSWASAVTDPCASYSYGNAADFTVNIQSGGGGGSTSPVTVTIGTGTSTTGYPYATYWHDGRTQILVTKAEILAAGGFPGEISNLAFNVSSVNTSYQPMNGFTINVQNYPGTLTGFVSSGWTNVLTTTYTVNTTGWNTHTFTTPFMWNGTDNLLFEVCFDNSSWSSYSYVYATSVASGLCYYRYTDGAAGCALTSPNSTTLRPNVRFTITPVAPATLKGYVTNGNTGASIIGAMVKAGDSITYTNASGYYQMAIRAGNTTITCSKLGYDEQTITANIAPNTTLQQDFALLENTPPPSVVYASLNAAQTAVDITWGLPMSGYAIIYDDDQFENMTAWAVEGNINALKFTPINQYPVQVTGGMVHIGDGSYPAGGNILTPFQIAVYKDDGTMGLPGTELAVVDVTPANYGWIPFSFNPPVTIQSGNFYIGMIQGGNYPNCAPIAIDESNPSMRSYSRFVTGNGPWVPSGYNDFMIRAFCYGAGGPLDLTETSQPRFIEKQRISKNSLFMKQPRIVQGYEGEAIYQPVPTLSSQSKSVNYSIPTSSWGFVSNNPNASDNAEVVNYGLPLPVVENPQSNPSDGVLFDNGPFINSPGTGPGGTDESIIVAGTNSYGFNFNNAIPYTVADDFTVTGTVPWAIGSVEFYGYQTGSTTTSTFTGGYIRIWNGDPSVGGSVIWGDLTTNRMTSTSWINAYRVNVSGGGTTRPIMKVVCSTPGLTLNPGTYWIEFSATGSIASGPWVLPVCLSTPASGNALQFTGTWGPIVSGTAPNTYPQGVPFKLNGAALTGLEYQVWRLKQGDETNPATWTSLGTTATTSIADNSWPTLPNGPYRWAVKAKYTGDRWSDAAFSNVLGKGWTSNVTFNITLSSSTATPQNVMVYMENTSPTADSIYWGLTPASGTINFPHVWKGNYNINIQKFGYQPYTANVDITQNTHTFNILLNETTWAPTDLWVDDRTLIAYWNAPNPQIALFEERWGSGNFTANQWTVNGTNWSVSSYDGNPAPSAEFNYSPQVTNYEQSIVSKDIQGQGSPGLYLKYDIYLNNYSTTNENQMAVEIWDGTAWNRLKNYTNILGSIPWTSESINISSYTWDTFKIRFLAYGVDSWDINYWNIDNIIVAAALSGKSVLGFDMYLDDIQIGFTTDTTYQIPHNLCLYGHSYTASVDAAYESGASDRDYYTFAAHYLPAPRNLEATPIQDAAYLTWDYPVVGGKSLQIGIPGMSTESVAEE
ncbi:MAG TPA: carboxypeptidase-like regulatory domain-containing protein, partial [Bacteroidales bacterium]|nr:carboxypeptidase-like regulatory domain-containing protein [Bacteroidales bacterium]